MAFDASKLKAIADQAAKVGPDMTKPQASGGTSTYEPPAAGLTRLRLVSYVEIGKQKDVWDGKERLREKVLLGFELSGPKHPPRELEDGTKVPHRITVEENLSLSEKANFYKLFKRMNYTGEATHMAQLLGQEFLGTVTHRKSKDGKRTYANLRDDAGHTIRPPYVEDPETGETRKIEVAPPISDLRLFVWDLADKEMWDSLFIDGEYDAIKDEKTGEVISPARSRNVLQNRIREATNFEGSPIANLLTENGDELDVPEAKDPKAEAAAEDEDDPLNGVV